MTIARPPITAASHCHKDHNALQSLSDRTAYEIGFLELAYELAEDMLFPKWPDNVILPMGSKQPIFYAHARANIRVGDWRSGFLEVGSPLIFISTFKLLDMLLEWVLELNGYVSTHRFTDKIAALKGPIAYPEFLTQRPWLLERLIALYEALEPLRGTIIHSRHFESMHGELRVSSSKRNSVGPERKLSPQLLRTLATTCFSIIRYVEGSWEIEPHRDNVLRWQMDNLSDLHSLHKLGQLEPYRSTVRVFLNESDPRLADVANVRKLLVAQYPNQSHIFDLRVLLVSAEEIVGSYFFPWSILSELKCVPDIRIFKTNLPLDLRSDHYAQVQ